MSAFTGKFFVLYAGRANSGELRSAVSLESADVLATAISEGQARQDSPWFSDATWWEHEVLNGRILGGICRWDIWVRLGRGSFRRAK